MNAPVIYTPNWLFFGREYNSGVSEMIFERLWENLSWERRPDAPRRECWMNDFDRPYTYGKGLGERTYQAVPWAEYPLLFQAMLQQETGVPFEGCFINGYEGPRDHLGWHADDSPEIANDRPIAVLSLGFPREIWFREYGSEVIEKQLLEDGSLLLMEAGMQQTHQHRIPKNSEAKCGRRISLTFRGLVA